MLYSANASLMSWPKLWTANEDRKTSKTTGGGRTLCPLQKLTESFDLRHERHEKLALISWDI